VDVGGSLAVASRGLYATGVSTDLNERGWVLWRCVESDSKMRQANLQLGRHWHSRRWNLQTRRENLLLAEVTPSQLSFWITSTS
ncbi:Bgt-1525, partial [Blumeria graminis f. sp. tritici]